MEKGRYGSVRNKKRGSVAGNATKEVKRSAADMAQRSLRMTHIQLGESKRRYAAHFVSKLTDCDGLRLCRAYGSESEASETDTWLDYAKDCGYMSTETHTDLTSACRSIGAMLGAMINNPKPFLQNDH